jgi:hypothetical protein
MDPGVNFDCASFVPALPAQRTILRRIVEALYSLRSEFSTTVRNLGVGISNDV